MSRGDRECREERKGHRERDTEKGTHIENRREKGKGRYRDHVHKSEQENGEKWRIIEVVNNEYRTTY